MADESSSTNFGEGQALRYLVSDLVMMVGIGGLLVNGALAMWWLDQAGQLPPYIGVVDPPFWIAFVGGAVGVHKWQPKVPRGEDAGDGMVPRVTRSCRAAGLDVSRCLLVFRGLRALCWAAFGVAAAAFLVLIT